MKIIKENYDEMLNLIADIVSNVEYNRECFSKTDLEIYALVWEELSLICEELVKAGVNFDKFVLPIMNEYGIELNEDKINDVRTTNISDCLPENLNIEVKCPLLENIEELTYGGFKLKGECRIKVANC